MNRALGMAALFAALFGVRGANGQDSDPAAPGPAVAERCARDAEEAQPLRRQGRYAAAILKFRACASSECPAVVAADCARWEAELAEAAPTLVLGARDREGRDLADATVRIDGSERRPVSGKALAVDPGTHELVFERLGETVAMTVVALDGQRGRVVVAEFGPRDVPAPPRDRAVTPAPAPASRDLTWPLVASGVAVALGVTGTTLVLGADARYDSLRATCGQTGSCTSDEVASNRRSFVVADAFLVASALAAAGALWLFLSPKAPNVTAR